MDNTLLNNYFFRIPQKLIRFLSALFILISIIYFIFFAYLAYINNSPGSPDSMNNFDTARNILHGEGFTSHIVIQHFMKQTLPNPEVIRNPGVPYLLAGLFKIFGINLAIPVLINAIVILLTAWIFRATVALLVDKAYADLAGILMLLSMNYELISILNNNFLVLCTVLLLYIVASYINGYIKPWHFALLSSLLTAAGFNMKYTFIFTALPLVILLSLFHILRQEKNKSKIFISLCIYVIVTIALCSPILIRNMNLFGKFIYAPQPLLRLAERYAIPDINAWRSVHFEYPVTINDLISRYGINWLVKNELIIWAKVVVKIFLLNLPLFILAIVLLFMKKQKGQLLLWVILLLSALEPLFSALYWRQETRYLWPLYPVLILLAGMLIKNVKIYSGNEKESLKQRLPIYVISLFLVASLIYGAAFNIKLLERSWSEARSDAPGWVKESREIPQGSIIITNAPWPVAWYSERCAVICPIGTRDDLLKVIDIYKPDYYLDTGEGFQNTNPQFLNNELELLAHGGKGQPDWVLYKLKMSD